MTVRTSQDTTQLLGGRGGDIPSMSARNAKGKVGSAGEAAAVLEGHEPDGFKKQKTQNKTKQLWGSRCVWRLLSKSKFWNLRFWGWTL